MPCRCPVPDDMGDGTCANCAQKIGAKPLMAATTRLSGVAAGTLRVILIGHGTFTESEGTFEVPPRVTIHFTSPHRSNAMGGTLELNVHDGETLRHPKPCYQYRLWPMVGELHVLDNAVPYHHAHRAQFIGHFRQQHQIYMYSARSMDGPRLSSIVNRVRQLAPPMTLLEFVWIACREVPTMPLAEIQRNMRFSSGADPIQYRNQTVSYA